MPALNELNEDELRDEINRLASEYCGEPQMVRGLEGKTRIWLFTKAAAYTMMVRLWQRGQELVARYSEDEQRAYSTGTPPPDDFLRAQALLASADALWRGAGMPVEADAFDKMLDELIAKLQTMYRGHQIAYRHGHYFIDSWAGGEASLIGAMRRVDKLEGE